MNRNFVNLGYNPFDFLRASHLCLEHTSLIWRVGRARGPVVCGLVHLTSILFANNYLNIFFFFFKLSTAPLFPKLYNNIV